MGLELFDDRRDAGRVLGRLSKVLELALDEVKLSLPQYRMLGWLEHGEQASARLAERMAVTPPSITALVDGLAQRGFVERRPDPNDRRRLPLHITPTGAEVLAGADAAIAARLDELRSHLDLDDAATALEGLACWLRAMETAREVKAQADAAAPMAAAR